MLAGLCQAQTTNDNLPGLPAATAINPASEWIHFPPRPSLNRAPAAATLKAAPSPMTPAPAPATAPSPEDSQTQRVATKPPSTASDWVQFPALPPPKVKSDKSKTAVAVPDKASNTATQPSTATVAATAPATQTSPSAEAPNKEPTAPSSPGPAAAQNLEVQFSFKAFKFQGNTVYTAQSLNNLIAKEVPTVKDLADIQKAAQAVANRYQEDGVLARVDLLPQDLTEGIVTITITEGKFSGARLETANSPKLPSDLLVRLVEKVQPIGEPVRLSRMDRATMLLNEVPGVQASVRLSTGQAEGQTEALIQVQDKNNWDGQVTLDNTGSVSVGTSRLSSQFNRYGLLGRADVGNLQYMHSQGLDYLRLGYNEPLGYSGARWGVNTEFTHYTVISGYDALDLHGPSNSLSVYMSQPWLRRRDFSSDWVVTAEHKNFKNISTFSSTQYKLDNLSGTLSMTSQDSLWRGGENNASLQLQRGFVDYDTTPSDNTEGGFTKWRLNMGRKNKINDKQLLQLSYQRQWANRNLDSSEKFGIGGASAVRAYPGGEVSGSEASVFSVEWQHDLAWNTQAFKLSAFYDRGDVTKYKYDAPTNNSYALEGVGLWIGTSIPNRWGMSQWRATWAHRLGSNPGASSTGADADGTYYPDRFWLSASQVF